MANPKNTSRSNEAGFTLIEMIVAAALFAVVMLVSTTALLALVGANRKAQSLQTVMNNLNVALDGMVRAMRMGSEYYCSTSSSGSNFTETRDCEEGLLFAFRPFNADSPDDRWVYWYKEDNGVGRIYKSETGDTDDGIAITAPTIDIASLKFYVVGTDSGDDDEDRIQPKVVIAIRGVAGGDNVKTRTEFSMQATAVQRVLDL